MLTDEENGVREKEREWKRNIAKLRIVSELYQEIHIQQAEKGKDIFGLFCVISKARKKRMQVRYYSLRLYIAQYGPDLSSESRSDSDENPNKVKV